ncbi:MAG: phosphatase PAP2 family protein [Caldilineaceae bacterium]|nr:phosphatase PAP2 family protein [Caldilineaceae bacterium]MBP8109463.1 phosphatase PAP2 family protein [Caldilineaceae bacterium]MBP8123647.1 phosphatase PAP2 family protein [Caldilineaceae bacterium]MBP9073087.1 phosphatase PAP2 family protein [Caldilineaceae bacterium]
MNGWLYDLISGGLPLIEQIQGFRTPFLDGFFKAATFLGEADFFLLLVPIFFWLINKRFGRNLAYLLVLSSVLFTGIKNILKMPRPPVALHLIEQAGYGFPSGHAVNAVSLWGYMGVIWHGLGRWVWPLVLVVMGAEAFSRLYLGVHYPLDSVGGLILGGLILFLWTRWEGRLAQWAGRLSLGQVVGGSALLALAVLFLVPGDGSYPVQDAATLGGLVLGANVGFHMEAHRVRFATAGSWMQLAGRLVLGFVVLMVVREGLALVFGVVLPDYETIVWVERTLRFVRYGVVGLTLTWWIPALFVRLGLAKTE